MAKPGSNGARHITRRGGAVDLTRAGLSDDEARRAQEMLEHRLGMRCDGCGRRITLGFKFFSIDPRHEAPVLYLAACSRDDCGYAEQCRDGATAMEMIEFAWLDVNGVDAPASLHIVERNKQHGRNPDGSVAAAEGTEADEQAQPMSHESREALDEEREKEIRRRR